MGRGLDSFDAFDWPSLLAGQDILVVDPNRRRGLKTADALEKAGGRATLSETIESACDRLLRARYRMVVAGLSPMACASDDALLDLVEGLDLPVLVLADESRQARIKHRMEARTDRVRIVDATIGERDLVLAITRSHDD